MQKDIVSFKTQSFSALERVWNNSPDSQKVKLAQVLEVHVNEVRRMGSASLQKVSQILDQAKAPEFNAHAA